MFLRAKTQASATSVNEGDLVYFYVVPPDAKTIVPGARIPFTISGTRLDPSRDITVESHSIFKVYRPDGAEIPGIFGGYVILDDQGKATIAVRVLADGLTESNESLNVEVGNLLQYGLPSEWAPSSTSIPINDTSTGWSNAQPTFSLSHKGASAGSTIDEGETAIIDLITKEVAPGTTVPYKIFGSDSTTGRNLNASDIGRSAYNTVGPGEQPVFYGSVVVGNDGRATIDIPIIADRLAEGDERLTVDLSNVSVGVWILIKDTSTPNTTNDVTYSLNHRGMSAGSTINEGEVASINLITTNVAPGTAVPYQITGRGLTAADIGISAFNISNSGGQPFSGTVVVDNDGKATIFISVISDNLTEGSEDLTVAVSNVSVGITINDTSLSPLTFFDSAVSNDSKVKISRIDDVTRIEGNQENNTLVGTEAIDKLSGGGGSDRFYSSKGNDAVDGGDGMDAVTFKGKSSDFRVQKAGFNWIVRDTRSDSSINQGEDILTAIERIGFEDKVLALDIDGVAGKAYRVYKAAFARDPIVGDQAGLGFWINSIDKGMDMVEVAARFIDSPEFRKLYGQNPSNAEFLTKVYTNVLGRTPDQGGYAWWLNQLNTNPEKTRQKVLADFAEIQENKESVVSLIGNGIQYIEFLS